jgi:hypothetical protein
MRDFLTRVLTTAGWKLIVPGAGVGFPLTAFCISVVSFP